MRLEMKMIIFLEKQWWKKEVILNLEIPSMAYMMLLMCMEI